jgi:hypothetical protein
MAAAADKAASPVPNSTTVIGSGICTGGDGGGTPGVKVAVGVDVSAGGTIVNVGVGVAVAVEVGVGGSAVGVSVTAAPSCATTTSTETPIEKITPIKNSRLIAMRIGLYR